MDLAFWFGERRARFREIRQRDNLARYAHEQESLAESLNNQLVSVKEQLEAERVKVRILELERDLLASVHSRNLARVESEGRLALKSMEQPE